MGFGMCCIVCGRIILKINTSKLHYTNALCKVYIIITLHLVETIDMSSTKLKKSSKLMAENLILSTKRSLQLEILSKNLDRALKKLHKELMKLKSIYKN